MARPDATAGAALENNQPFLPVYFIYLDFDGDPVRANTSGRDLTLAGTGQPDLDGEYFGVSPKVVSVSPVRMASGGSKPVTVRASGLPDLDDDLLEAIHNRTAWQSRTARLWQMIRNVDRVPQGAIRHYHTGYMMNVAVRGARGSQIIDLTIESYLASYSAPSGRTYLDAEDFDPGDMSARAAIAIANGISGNPLVSSTPSPNTGGGGGGLFGAGGTIDRLFSGRVTHV